MSNESGYSFKTLSEKLLATKTNPYDPEVDASLSVHFPTPLLDKNSNLRDLAKLAKIAIEKANVPKKIDVSTFETAYANLKIQVFRNDLLGGEAISKLISQASYLINFDPKKLGFKEALLPITSHDLENVLHTIDDVAANRAEVSDARRKIFQELLSSFTDRVTIQTLKTAPFGFQIPVSSLLDGKEFKAKARFSPYLPPEVILLTDTESPQDSQWIEGVILKKQNSLIFKSKEKETPLDKVILRLPANLIVNAKLENDLSDVQATEELPFLISLQIQNTQIEAKVLKGSMQIANFTTAPSSKSEPLWIERQGNEFVLPKNTLLGDGILLPKSFKESDVLIGDEGTFSYFAPGATSLSEQKIPLFVAGFYDPGIIPIGGKLVLARQDVVSLIEAAQITEENLLPSGFNVNFSDYKLAKTVKDEIIANLKKLNIAQFFTVQTYDEYDFTKDIFQQLKSERNLFSLISVIIVIVACSNIISMLVILVHDKQKEIAILRALGASKASVGFIFGLCGFLMGVCGSILGAILSYITVKNMNELLAFIGKLQGFEVLNASFYGSTVPTDVSLRAMVLVIGVTAIISTLAGLIAAIKASRQNTSDALRTE